MKIPMPPTGGQGGHYNFGSSRKTRIFDPKRATSENERVPRKFRRLRLRRRRRSRMMSDHPLMTVFVLLLLAVPLFWIGSTLVDLFVRVILN